MKKESDIAPGVVVNHYGDLHTVDHIVQGSEYDWVATRTKSDLGFFVQFPVYEAHRADGETR